MMCGLPWWQCGRSSVTPPQLHVWIAKCAPTWCSSIEIIPCDTIGVALIVQVQPIEVGVGTVVVPPGTSIRWSTITTVPVIVSVISGEPLTIQVVCCHAVACYPYSPVLVTSNSESVVGARNAHMKRVITGILGMACKVSKVNSQLSLHSYWRKTANLLQTQPVFSFHITKPILIFYPSSVEAHRPITPSLEHGPAPSVIHVTPDREGPPTAWIYCVHSWPSAAKDIGLLAVKGVGVQVSTADCRGDSIWNNGGLVHIKLLCHIARCKQV